MQQTKKFKMADAISPYLAVSCGLIAIDAITDTSWRPVQYILTLSVRYSN